MSIATLRDKRARMVEEARSIIDKAGNDGQVLSADDNARFEAIMADVDATRIQITRLEKLEDEERSLGETRGRRVPVSGDYRPQDDSLRAWLLAGTDARLSDEQSRSLASAGLMGKQYTVSLGDWQNRAQSVGTATAGGHTVAPTFAGEIDRALKAYGGVRNVARVLRTATGADMPFPTVDDTGNTGSIITENAVYPASNDVVFGSKSLKAFKYGSGDPLKVSLELLQDSAISIPELVGELLGERLARAQNAHFTTGTGTAQPEGIVTASTLGVTAASQTAIMADELLDLIHSLDPAYRNGASFMLNDATLKVIRKLKGSDGQYLWQPSTREGIPATIFGYPYEINQDMASGASQVKTVLFGQFKKTIVRDVKDITLVRLDERYAEYGQVAFTAIARADSRVINPSAIRHLKQAT